MASFVWVDEDRERTIVLEIEATVVRYVPARTNCRNDDVMPPEGGYLEDETFTVSRFTLCFGQGKTFDVDLDTDARRIVAEDFHRCYDGDEVLRREVYERFVR